MVLERRRNRKAAVVEAVERHYYLTLAAESVGVDPRVVRRWVGSDPVFAAAVETSRRIASERFEEAVLAAAAVKDVAAVRCAEAVLRRVDANESRRLAWRRADRQDARMAGVDGPEIVEGDCAEALAWARRPRLEAV